jgi:hypothetical protein
MPISYDKIVNYIRSLVLALVLGGFALVGTVHAEDGSAREAAMGLVSKIETRLDALDADIEELELEAELSGGDALMDKLLKEFRAMRAMLVESRDMALEIAVEEKSEGAVQ